MKQNDNIGYETITDYWKDTGTPEDILNANRQVLEHIGNQTGSIIGKNCKIDESDLIGPSGSIGDDTIISSDVVIENSIIMSSCIIDGGLNIKNSIISANCHLHGNNKDKTEKVFLLGEGTKIYL